MWKRGRRWTIDADVLVVGSGAAGMAAALAARAAGARVVMIEKAAKVGGTTAVSGGVLWIPNSHRMAEQGIKDTRADALTYLLRLADGRSDETLIERFVDVAPEMLRFIEKMTPLAFTALARYPDYHPEFPGGKAGGRSLDPGLFDTHLLGPWREKLRRSPVFGITAMTITEATDWGVFSNPRGLPFAVLGQRLRQGLICYGGALVSGLLKGLLDQGVEPMLGVPARALVVENDRVVGVQAGELSIAARRGVVLASGGFEWNKQLNAQFLGGQLTHPNSPPTNEGDGLKMAMALGADLGNMSEAWWCPSLDIPGEEYDGRPLHRGDFATRSLPRSIIVNRAGRRFVNEAHNYNDMMKPFFHFDPVAYERPNLPAWLILDRLHLERYGLLTYLPGMPLPDWLPRADTPQALAERVGIDPAGLAATVAHFNQFAAAGVDRDFRRGESVYDHFYGDPANRPNPNLGPLDAPPFYAVQVHPGAIGTKGGVKVDANARVLRVDGEAIAGLYAAGNVMAGITGPGYPGAGATIGTAMTYGYLAGSHAARQETHA